MAAERGAATRGLCHRCQQPIRAGDEARLPVEQATSASPDVLLHRELCNPRAARARTSS
ncbi:hypothetical protein [Streptomyces sp. NPDC020983]|uniref:hypothetical protein n=1 Tax=Streptomyces sp. NPDC020983 TaxID=3365106 RepID=UPI0037A3C8A9